ncbi:cytochrome P450 [Mycena vulgaris]|nr:cytochrome P450 [Mycena vulgaris]
MILLPGWFANPSNATPKTRPLSIPSLTASFYSLWRNQDDYYHHHQPTNAVLYIWSVPASQNVVTTLREEAERVFAEHNREWTKAAVAKLVRLDSPIRKSARVSSIGGCALARRTKVDVALPNGLIIPKDNCVGVSLDGIHFDEEYYPRAREYDAFRFSRPREEATLAEKPRTNEDLLTTSATWLPFSHGIHACPGRFFAANNLKMILAHLLINYDI